MNQEGASGHNWMGRALATAEKKILWKTRNPSKTIINRIDRMNRIKGSRFKLKNDFVFILYILFIPVNKRFCFSFLVPACPAWK
jgi:hypothetical protein